MTDKFCPAHGLCTKVKTLAGNVLTLADDAVEADLCDQLSEVTGKYTRLMLSTGVGFSEFKVTCVGGCLKLSPSPTSTFLPGDKVWYESCSKANIADLMACITEEEAAEDAVDFKIAGYVLETNDDGEKCWVIDPDTKQSVTFQVGKQVITIAGNGCPSVAPAEAGTFPEDGTYQYATVTTQGCQVVALANGTKPVCGSCGCCCGDKAEEVTTAGVV